MPQVEVSEVISAPVQRVWDVLNDIEAYPQLMEPVRSLKVIETGTGYRLAVWEVDIKGCVMRWTEREEPDPANYRLEYRAIDGDLDEFAGFWQLEALSETTSRATLFVKFDIGLPMLSDMLNPVAERAIHDNSRKMLQAIASHAVETIHDSPAAG